MRWQLDLADSRAAAPLGRALKLPTALAQVLWQRGLREPAAAERFLNPKLRHLDDPFRIRHLERAVGRLRQAISRAEEVMVFGDYDVDGVTSTALLISILRLFGLRPRFVVPRRLEEGYGLSGTSLQRAYELGPFSLFIAVDCGTNSSVEIADLLGRGIDVIVLDHHLAKEPPHAGAIVVNPAVFDAEDEPWRHLCTVGLVFKLVHGLLKSLRDDGDPVARDVQIKEYLDLVALGTIADLVPLRAENRILARAGLDRLKQTSHAGLCALLEIAGLPLGSDITPFDIAFRLSPRINACGRLADATLPIELLLSSDRDVCQERARQLDELNRERQEIERRVAAEAEARIDALPALPAALVVHDPSWHAGVVSVVASRLMQKYHRPAIVLGMENDLARGSGRSFGGVNLIDALGQCAHLLTHWGGHPMAVGVTLPVAQVPALAEGFANAVTTLQAGPPPEPEVVISSWVEIGDITPAFLDQLAAFQPFGQGNPEPIFGFRGVELPVAPEPFGHSHFRFQLAHGNHRRLYGVAWKMAGQIPPTRQPIDAAARLSWNHFNGKRYPQAELVAWRPAC